MVKVGKPYMDGMGETSETSRYFFLSPKPTMHPTCLQGITLQYPHVPGQFLRLQVVVLLLF